MKLLLSALLLFSTLAAAQPPGPPPAGGPETCSLATLRGDYLYAQDGFHVEGADARSRTPFAQAGHEVFDGAGKMKGWFSASENGKVVRGTYTATYTLKADCSGAIIITDNAKKV